MIIEFNEEDFKVCSEYIIGEIPYRIVYYNTGFHSIQYYMYDDDEWVDWVISPVQEFKHYEEVNFSIAFIQLVLIISYMKDSEMLFNGKNWTIQVQLDGNSAKQFEEEIKKEDAHDFVKIIKDLNYYNEQMIYEYNNNVQNQNVLIIIFIIIVIVIGACLFVI